MTATQIRAVMEHLYDHEIVNQRVYDRNDQADADWRRGDSECVPQWVHATFSEWRIGFQTEDWCFLAQWLPAAKIKARNKDIETAVKIRTTFNVRAKTKAIRGARSAAERAASKLKLSASAVTRGKNRADKYEADSKRFWLTFLAKHSS